MLSIITNTFTAMPDWAQLLIAWPLPSLCVALFLLWGYSTELSSPYRSQREGVVPMIWFLSIIWPAFFVIVIFGLLMETVQWLDDNGAKPWRAFGKWAKNKHAAHQRIRTYKAQNKTAAKVQKEYVHMYENHTKPRTVCGVGKPSGVRKTITFHEVTCPVCLGIMRRNRNG